MTKTWLKKEVVDFYKKIRTCNHNIVLSKLGFYDVI